MKFSRIAKASLAVTLIQSDSIGRGKNYITTDEINSEIRRVRKRQYKKRKSTPVE